MAQHLQGYGYRFFSHSDSEVLLKAYHRWGDDFVSHLMGMFAFAIVERDSGRVVLGRDTGRLPRLWRNTLAEAVGAQGDDLDVTPRVIS